VRKYYLFDDESASAAASISGEARPTPTQSTHRNGRPISPERYGTPAEIRYFETSVVGRKREEKTILDAAA